VEANLFDGLNFPEFLPRNLYVSIESNVATLTAIDLSHFHPKVPSGSETAQYLRLDITRGVENPKKLLLLDFEDTTKGMNPET